MVMSRGMANRALPIGSYGPYKASANGLGRDRPGHRHEADGIGTPSWDRRRWSGAEQREALRISPPDGYVYTCGGCGADMPDDEATYSPFHKDYVCKACAC